MSIRPEVTVQDWNRLNRLLEHGLALSAEERSAWLDALPAESAHLHDLLARLLAESDATGFADDAPVPTSVGRLAADALTDMRRERIGDRIGPWRLERLLAEGGMGAVWIAQRADGVMQRTAALKLPRAEWVDRGLTQRIARERTILARLQHPHIAVLYDAGITAEGRPYLALEYVDGEPIDVYCRGATDELQPLLRLFVQVVRAVAYAHSRLVIHRDLKPSNVLVTADATPKLLDFGISKLLEGDAPTTEETALTRMAGRPLTLSYAAPEQILGLPVSVAVDIYALGVMLYELLSGRRPYRSTSPRALEEEILRGDVKRPSEVATDKQRAKTLRGDLDAIVLKALKREPEARYETAAALADDIERHLAGRVVHAQPDSRTYRLRKFILRNRLAVAAGSMVVLALAIGLGTAMWQTNVASDEAQRATALNTFVLSLIQQADPIVSQQTRDADLATLATIEERIDREFKGRPKELLQLRLTIGDAYRNRGEMIAARRVFQRAVNEATPSLAADDLTLLTARVKAASPNLIISTEASQDLERAIEILRAKGRAGSEVLIDALFYRDVMQVEYGLPAFVPIEKSYQNLKDAFDLATRHFGEGSRQQLRVLPMLSNMKLAIEGPAETQRLFESSFAHAVARPDGASSSFEYAYAKSQYAKYLCRTGRSAEGISMLWDLADAVRAAHGANSAVLENIVATLGQCFIEIGDSTGHRFLEDAFEIAAARERSPSTNLLYRAEEAMYQMSRIHDEKAWERYYQHAVANSHAIPEQALREKRMHQVMMNRVCLLSRRGEADEAESVAAPLVTYFDAEFRRIGRLTPGQGDLWLCLSFAQRQNGRFAEAVQTAQTMVDRCRATQLKLPSGSRWRNNWNRPVRCEGRALAMRALAELESGRAAEALVTVEERLKISTELGRDWIFINAYGRALLANGRAQEAIEPLRISYGEWLGIVPQSVFTAEAEYWFGQAYLAVGDKRGKWMVAEAKQRLAKSPLKSHQALAREPVPSSKVSMTHR